MNIELIKKKSGIVGESEEIKQVLEMVSQVAGVDISVLINGESGTGKELVAKAIHTASMRSSKNLIINHLGLKSSYSEKIYEYEFIKLRNWHYMWSFFYYHKKNEGFLKALIASKGRLFRSLLKIFYFSIIINRKERLKYSYRFLGLVNSIIGKKSWFRIND